MKYLISCRKLNNNLNKYTVMKKIILLVALFGCAICAINAQTFTTDSRYVGASVGVGGGHGVPITLYYEQAVYDKIGVGGIIGFGCSTENDWRYSNLLFGIRGNYHFLEHITTGTQWDTYGGLILGYNVVSAKWKGEGDATVSASSSAVIFGAQVGARYSFNDAWAAFAEVGYGIGILSLGATFSF